MSLFSLKQELFFLICKTGLLSTKKTILTQNTETICVDMSKCTELIYTKRTYYINEKNVTGYFRECKEHKNKKEYLYDCIRNYFVKNNNDQLKKEILSSLNNNINFKRFYHMGTPVDKSSKYKRAETTKNYKIIGLTKIKEENYEECNRFLENICSDIYTYRINETIKAGGGLETFYAYRSIAEEEIASIFKLSDLFVKTKFITLKDKKTGKKMIGTLSSVAEGENIDNIKPNDKKITDSFRLKLMDLFCLDAIMYEKDHRINNLNITINKNKYESLICFDNDSPMSFAPVPLTNFNSYSFRKKLLRNGEINLPFISKNIADAILEFNKNTINENKILFNTLNTLQRWFLIQRVCRIRTALIKTIKNRDNFIVGDKTIIK